MKAPIIVLEGLDACGKSTQTELLIENLKNKNISVAWKRFPGYDKTPAGPRIAAYLRGEFGNMENLDPIMIASLYASDRLFQLEEIEKMRNEFDILIFDRSVSSNIIYTAARGETKSKIQHLIESVEKLEYDIFGFPRESLILFLDASEKARQQIHKAKNRLADLHEKNERYLKQVREVAMDRCEKDFRWITIEVDRFGELRRREDIAEEILTIVLEKLQKRKKGS